MWADKLATWSVDWKAVKSVDVTAGTRVVELVVYLDVTTVVQLAGSLGLLWVVNLVVWMAAPMAAR